MNNYDFTHTTLDPEDAWIAENVERVSGWSAHFRGAPDTWRLVSLWAFFFGFLSYLFAGMWRKAIVILIIYTVLYAVVLGIVTANPNNLGVAQFLNLVVWIGYNALWAMNYKFDRYRHRVLNQRFWW